MFRQRINPGDGIHKKEIYEVWGDIIEMAASQGHVVLGLIEAFFRQANLPDDFTCRRHYVEDGRSFLVVEWGNRIAHIDARPFGAHLDVYAILALRRGLIDSPDPNTRISELDGVERRDLQVFQTLLHHAVEQSLTAFEEGSAV